MPRGPRKQCDSNIYHVTHRGIGHQIIFEDGEDRLCLANLCRRHFSTYNVYVLAWCFMDNHFHFVLYGKMPDISKAMGVVCTQYALRFNKRHGRCGHLFQNRFFSKGIESKSQLMKTIRYVHQNPEEIGRGLFRRYRWSSYRAFFESGEKVKRELIAVQVCYVLELFGSRESFRLFHETKPNKVFGSVLDAEVLCNEARRVLGRRDLHSIASLAKKDRDACLRLLLDAGFSLRQIERLTSVSRSVVARAKVGQKVNVPSVPLK